MRSDTPWAVNNGMGTRTREPAGEDLRNKTCTGGSQSVCHLLPLQRNSESFMHLLDMFYYPMTSDVADEFS